MQKRIYSVKKVREAEFFTFLRDFLHFKANKKYLKPYDPKQE